MKKYMLIAIICCTTLLSGLSIYDRVYTIPSLQYKNVELENQLYDQEVDVQQLKDITETFQEDIEHLKDQNRQLKKELSERKWRELGTFKITNYCSCETCSGGWGTTTKLGTTAKPNHTIAVDPDVIALGSEVLIDGEVYIAEDVGGAVKSNVIDVYVDDCKDGFGRKYSKVYVKV